MRQAGYNPPRCAVNLSARQFAADRLVDEVREALAMHGLEAGALTVEITEGQLMAGPEQAQQTLQTVQALGVQVAIDDFVTASTLKIDRSFVRGLPHNHQDMAIAQAEVTLAHSLRMAVVAEGAETLAQMQAVQRPGCDMVQGFLLARPLAPAQIVAQLPRWLSDQAGLAAG